MQQWKAKVPGHSSVQSVQLLSHVRLFATQWTAAHRASWDFFGRTDAKAETPILWPPHANSWLIGKDPDAGRDWGQEEKGTAEDEMAGWHHWLDGHEFEWTPGVGDGQGGLVCCDSWGRKESDTTEWLNWTGTALSLMLLPCIGLKVLREANNSQGLLLGLQLIPRLLFYKGLFLRYFNLNLPALNFLY